MGRKKTTGKTAFDEACRVAREAAKNSEEKPGERPKKEELKGCLMSIIRILSKMAESAGMSSNADLVLAPSLPLIEPLANAYTQKTINTAFLFLFMHLGDGLIKIGSEDAGAVAARTPSETEKAALVHRIFFLSFIVNGMFL